MKAIVLRKTGGIENLTLENIPEPTLLQNEVLVQVKAISVNPVDTSVRSNEKWLNYILGLKGDEPYAIIGWDISGVVVKTGEAVHKFKVGDEVFGMVNFRGQGKAYAEFVSAPEGHLALKPANVSHQEAAGSTLAALTAWQAIVTNADLKAGERILIQAAAGGVGHFAVQIAKHLGAHVIAVASKRNETFVRSLGADEFIDYHNQSIESVVRDADVAIDALRDPENTRQLIRTLRTGGRLISLVNRLEDEIVKNEASVKGLQTYAHWVESDGDDMESIAKLLASGKLKTHISHEFRFEDMALAHQQIETGHTVGKVIVSL